MVYKSKKINRRSLQKRQSRKRMYGGASDNNSEYSMPPPPPEIPEKKEVIPTPTLNDNLEDAGEVAADIGNIAVSAGIQGVKNLTNSFAESIGVDPNNSASEVVQELTDSAKKLTNVLNSPQGEELKKEAAEIASDFVDILKPAANDMLNTANELLEKEIPIAGNMLNEAALMIPGAGQVIGAVEEMGNVAQAVEGAVESTAKLTQTGTDTLSKLETNREKVSSFWDKLTNLMNNGVKDGIGIVKSGVDSLKKNIKPKMPIDIKPKIPNIPSTVEAAGGSLKKYQKEAIMIGGRVVQSQSEFLSPKDNSSQILRQYGGKRHTKRRNRVRSRLTSRRR